MPTVKTMLKHAVNHHDHMAFLVTETGGNSFANQLGFLRVKVISKHTIHWKGKANNIIVN